MMGECNGGNNWERRNMNEIYKAITLVALDLSREGIGKDRKNMQQGYSFRGIDDMYNALAPLLARAGLCILPRVLSRECVERTTTKGAVLFYVTVDVEFDFVAASDGSRHTVKVFGEAMDSADKATNKAMSAAYKYACMQAFCIPTEGDNDSDATTHEVKAAARPLPAAHKPVDGAMESLSADDQAHIRGLAIEVIAMVADNDPIGANQFIAEAGLVADEKVALWSQLDSKVRSALKKAAAAEVA
jgi:hypothetical protein